MILVAGEVGERQLLGFDTAGQFLSGERTEGLAVVFDEVRHASIFSSPLAPACPLKPSSSSGIDPSDC
jgi:hypothetical protein